METNDITNMRKILRNAEKKPRPPQLKNPNQPTIQITEQNDFVFQEWYENMTLKNIIEIVSFCFLNFEIHGVYMYTCIFNLLCEFVVAVKGL